MSQEKVDRYKKDKAHRKKMMKKEKLEIYAARIAGVIVCVAILGWAGYSGYTRWDASRPAKTTEISIDALSDYMSSLGD